MKRLVVATGNTGKLKEIRAILADLPVDVVSLADYPGVEPVERVNLLDLSALTSPLPGARSEPE